MMSKEKYGLRKITESDYDFVYLVKKNAYQKYVEMYYGNWNEEEQRDYFKKFIETYKDGAFIITLNGKSIGFYNGCAVDDIYEIGNICIIPEYQNRGIGTAILKDVIADNSDRSIRIQYFKKNPVGRLYERLGFIRVSETAFHYGMMKEKEMNWDLTDKIS